MIKRWLRRRLAARMPDSENTSDDEEPDRGNLVRKGRLVSLRTHVSGNRDAFQRWYADPEIAELLRHDLEPLSWAQSRAYFDTFILPASAKGFCFAIHERKTKRLIGTTALTDITTGKNGRSALFRIVIGEKECWGKGYGTEATQLVVKEAFDALQLDEVRLEVFSHNDRARAAYARVGFEVSGEHVEWVPRRKMELRVIEMRMSRGAFAEDGVASRSHPVEPDADERGVRRRRREERVSAREERQARRMETHAAKNRLGFQERSPQRPPRQAPEPD